MTQLILCTPDKTRFAHMAMGIERLGGIVGWAGSGREVLETIAVAPVDLVLLDEDLGDMTGLELVKRLVAANPLINCALVSSLSAESYHAVSEGLGLLMQLPPKPGIADGERLMAHLNRIVGASATKR